MRPQLVRPRPKADESILGYILRLAEENGHPEPSVILKAGGVIQGIRDPRHLAAILKLEPLARRSGVDPEILARLLHTPAGAGDKEILVFGQPIAEHLVRMGPCRVCPPCLREALYIRRIWDVTLVCCCPTHGTLLLNACPGCGQPLSVYRKGVATCRCGANLLDVDLPPASDEAVALAGRIHSLCGCDRQGVRRATQIIGTLLAGLDLSALAEAVLFAAKLHVDALNAVHLSTHPIPELHELVSSAVSVFRDWPVQFHVVLQDLRARQERALGATGGALLFRAIDRNLQKISSEYCRRALSEAYREYLAADRDGKLHLSTGRQVVQEASGGRAPVIAAETKKLGVASRLARREAMRGKSRGVRQPLDEPTTRAVGGGAAPLSVAAAARALHVPEDVASFFLKAGLLGGRRVGKKTPAEWAVPADALQRFQRTFVTSEELSKRHQISEEDVAERLRRRGLEPVSDPGVDHGPLYLYRRDEIPRTAFRYRRRAPRLLTIQQVSDLLHLSVEQVQQFVDAGKLRSHFQRGRDTPLFSRFAVERCRKRHVEQLAVLTGAEASALLGENPSWFFQKYVDTGRLRKAPFCEELGKAYFFRSDVEALVEELRGTIRAEEVASLLGVYRTTVLKMTRRGDLPAVSGPHVDGFGWYLYPKQEIERLARERRECLAREALERAAKVNIHEGTITSGEAANILGVHPNTVLNLTKQGILRAASGPEIDGRCRHRYRKEEVEGLTRKRSAEGFGRPAEARMASDGV